MGDNRIFLRVAIRIVTLFIYVHMGGRCPPTGGWHMLSAFWQFPCYPMHVHHGPTFCVRVCCSSVFVSNRRPSPPRQKSTFMFVVVYAYTAVPCVFVLGLCPHKHRCTHLLELHVPHFLSGREGILDFMVTGLSIQLNS